MVECPEYLWNIYRVFMEYLWSIHTVFMDKSLLLSLLIHGPTRLILMFPLLLRCPPYSLNHSTCAFVFPNVVNYYIVYGVVLCADKTQILSLLYYDDDGRWCSADNNVCGRQPSWILPLCLPPSAPQLISHPNVFHSMLTTMRTLTHLFEMDDDDSKTSYLIIKNYVLVVFRPQQRIHFHAFQ